MKKVFSLIFILLTLLFFVGCGESDPKMVSSEGDEVVDDDGENIEDSEIQNDEENEENDETLIDEEVVNDDEPEVIEEPDEPIEEPDDNPLPGSDVIGTFNLNYSGQLNATIGLQSRGGDGTVEFVYNNQPITFSKINVGINLFPLAMINSGNIIIVWLDNFSLGDLQGTAQKQVFGISIPQNTVVGSGEMVNANMYAFYGDMVVNITGGQFDVKCVRSVSNVGNYNVTDITESNISMTANGDLLDPAAGAAYLPYPACE